MAPIDFESEETKRVLLILIKEGIAKGRVFICDECQSLFLKEEKAAVDPNGNGAVVCRDCAKKALREVSAKNTNPTDNFHHQQIKGILDKISETEKEYNSLVEASRQGVDWENEIESRRLRIQSLKRQLFDYKNRDNP